MQNIPSYELHSVNAMGTTICAKYTALLTALATSDYDATAIVSQPQEIQDILLTYSLRFPSILESSHEVSNPSSVHRARHHW